MAHYLKKELYDLIKKDESIFDFIQDGSLDGLWYWDLEKPENEWMNARFWEVLGYDPEEMPHKASAWQDIINHDDLKLALENFHQHVEDPTHPYDQEVRYTHKNGSTVWVRCRGLAIRDEHGNAVRMVGAHQDITSLKNSQEQFRLEHEKVRSDKELYRFLTENTSDIIRYQSESGEFNYISPNILEVTGYTAEEYAKFGPVENVVPEDHHILQNAVEKFAEGMENISLEYRIYHKSGAVIWLESRIKAIRDDQGVATSLLSSSNDITEKKNIAHQLKQSETRYKQLVETAVDAIYLIDENGVVVDTNYQATLMLEKSKEEIIGQTVEVIDPNFPAEAFLEYWDSFPYDQQRTFETSHIDSSGAIIPIEISGKKFQIEGKTYYYGIARNISERKNSEKELKRERDFLQKVIDSVPARIFWKDRNSVYMGCNTSFVNDCGKDSHEQVIGQADDVMIWKQDAELYRADDNMVMQSGEPKLKYEEPFLDKNGDQVVWRTSKVPLKNDHGEVIGVLATSENVTKEKNAEEELKKKQYHLENAQSLGKIGSWDLDILSDSLVWTDENYRIFGIPVGTPMNYNLFLNQVHPDDRDYVDSKWSAAIRGEEAYDINHRLLMDDGEMKWVREKANLVFDENKKCIRGIGFTQDITERIKFEKLIQEQVKEYQSLNEEYQALNEELRTTNEELKEAFFSVDASERKFKSYIENAPDGIFITDENGNYVEANHAASRITGYSNKELLKKSIPDLLQEKDIEKGIEHFGSAVKEGYAEGELGFVTKDGENRFWKVAAVKLEENRFLGFVKDITNQRVYQNQLEASEKRFRELVDTINSGVAIYKVLNKGESGSDYVIQDFNQFSLDHEQMSKEDVIGKRLKDIRPNIDDYGLIDVFREVWETGKSQFFPAMVYVDENFSHYYENRVFRLPNMEIVAIYDDVTARESARLKLADSESKLKSIIENSTNLFFAHSVDHEITFISPQVKEFLGYEPSEVMNDWTKFVTDNPINEKALAYTEKAIETGERQPTYELEMLRKDGGKIIVEVREAPVIENGKVVSIVGSLADITDRKLAEQKILEQNEEYEALNEELRQTNDELSATLRREDEVNDRFNKTMEATSDGIFDWNLITNEIYYSPRWKAILGYKENELPNDFSVWEELTDAKDVKRSWNLLNDLIDGNVDKFDIEFKMKHKDGHWVDIHSRADVFHNKEGKANRIVGTHTDITARKKAEELIHISEQELKISDSRYRKAEEIGNVGNWEYIIESDEFWASDESKRIYGFEIENQSFSTQDVESCIPERVRVHQALIDLITKEMPYNLEFDLIAKNTGQRKTITSIAELIKDSDGKPHKVVGVIQDITQRKKVENEIRESEEKLRLAIDNSPIGITINDMEGKFVSVNKAYEAIVGYSEEELLKMSFFDITHKDFLPKNKELFDAMASKKEPGFAIEKKYIHKNGNIIDVRINAGSICDADGNTLFGMAFTEDITKEKASIEELKLAKEKAEEANALKTEFLHNMSHEIRTPMNGIMGFSNLLCDLNGCSETQLHYSKIIHNSSKQLLSIIDDILEISTLETKQLSIQESEFDVNLFLMDLFAIYDLKSKERNLPLYVDTALPNGSSLVISDKIKLNKILSNLLDNAFKFTRTGAIELGYTISDSNIVFYVKDTGIGISDDKLTRIFERFSQESDKTAQTYGGLGLGLSIAKENSELLGGRIRVETEKDKGTTFFVEIPFRQSEEAKINRTKTLEAERENDVANILIVEDEGVNYLYLATILEQQNEYPVKLYHAINGEDAVEICHSNKAIDIVLMDIKMPGMNGYIATKKIKELRPDLPIIVQTAYSTSIEKNTALQHGCDDFISKPIMKNDLLLLIKKQLKK